MPEHGACEVSKFGVLAWFSRNAGSLCIVAPNTFHTPKDLKPSSSLDLLAPKTFHAHKGDTLNSPAHLLITGATVNNLGATLPDPSELLLFMLCHPLG